MDTKERIITVDGIKVYIPKSPKSIDDWIKDFEVRRLSIKTTNEMIVALEEELKIKPEYIVDSEVIELRIILKALNIYVKR